MRRRPLIYGAGAAGGIAALGLALFMLQKPALLEDTGFSRAVFDRNGALLHLTLSKDEKYRLHTPLAAISPRLRKAVLLHEDQYFYAHPGINPGAMLRAFAQTYLGAGRRLGASTITMQLARLKHGLNSRAIPGKLYQMLCALRLELHYSKDELFEAYLNLAPYGYNIEGIGAASYIYFRASPSALTLPQALTLATIPQSPTRRRLDAAAPAKPAPLQARNRLFERWLAEHPADSDQQLFFKLPLTSYSRRALPKTAPHLTRTLLRQYPDTPQIAATIDAPIQQRLETILRRYVADKREIGISNASALLIDTRTMQAVASIGSADFADAAISGQVDGTRARRSPGSALKPFIYALAFDQGLIHPQSILADTPTGFGSYNPDNFERDFRGPIPAADALRLSRNIPAIKLAAQLRRPTLYEFFTRAAISRLRPAPDYGLSLVLGGAEVTARELATLYAMLANDGRLRPLLFQTTIPEPAEPKNLLSPEAAFLTRAILSQSPHPLRPGPDPAIAWKTGTSNGFHDAWTAGLFGPYALVVWVGNFSGKSSPSLVGVRSAAPLFFAMADALRDTAGYPPIAAAARNYRLSRVTICAATGDLDLTGCSIRRQSWFIPGVSPLRGAAIMRPLLVNLQTGQQACRLIPGVTAYRNFEVWPSELRLALRRAGIMQPELPPLEPGCTAARPPGGQAPVITTPQPHIVYQTRPGSAEDAILLRASADGAAQKLHWFIDNRYLGQTAPEDPLAWRPAPGRYKIRVVDDTGRSASMTTQVTLAPL